MSTKASASNRIFLKIEPINSYSPLAPITCSRRYGRDCMFNEGHESGRVTPQKIFSSTLDALVYREYLDPDYTIPNTSIWRIAIREAASFCRPLKTSA